MRREGGVSSAEGRAKLTGSVGVEPKQPTLNTTREIQIVHEATIERIESALALSEQVRYRSLRRTGTRRRKLPDSKHT